MNVIPLSSDSGDDGDGGGGGGVYSGTKVRKPYTITKSRESWSQEDHDDKFLEALQLFDCDWKRIEDFVGSKTVLQIRSHAQKDFLKVEKNGTIAHVPPPRPKRKAAYPYPQKAPKNVLVPLQASMPQPQPSSMINAFVLLPGQISWDEASILMSTVSCKNIPANEVENFPGAEADIGSKGISRINCDQLSGAVNSSKTFCSSEEQERKSKAPALHGLPDFAEVYTFIGSVFDPDIESHMPKLKEMSPINFETVLLLLRNLTYLSNPDFEPMMKERPTSDLQTDIRHLPWNHINKSL